MTTSVFLTNLCWVLLLANWVVEWNWKEKVSALKQSHLLQAFLILALVHVLWLPITQNMEYALFDLQKKLPLLVIPLVVLTTPPLKPRERTAVAAAYCATVFVVSVIGLVRYLTIPDLPYRNIVPHISHIRFGLNVCLTLFIVAYAAFKLRRPGIIITTSIVSLWFIAFLFLLHAYTAYIILGITVVVLLFAYRHRMTKRLFNIAALSVGAIIAATTVLAICYSYDYYHLRPLSTQTPPACTVNGNPYLHLSDNLIENGNYVHLYVCEKEMRQEWNKLSDYPFDSLTSTGYTIYPALLRYLGAMGLTKDSLGMTHLQPNDIYAIEKGIANPVYLQPGPRKLFYVLFYEFENYRCFHNVSNFSLLQRFELWQHAWRAFLQHPLFGVGTGDAVEALHQQLEASDSPLANNGMHTHNQYLNFLLAFGLLGFLLIVSSFYRAIRRGRLCMNPLFTAVLCIILISFTSEDTLETLAGITFVALGLTLLAFHSSPSHTPSPHPQKTCTNTTH